MGDGVQGVQSVDRAMQVLKYLARAGPAGVTEVAYDLGVHKSNAHRLLASLGEHGAVEQQPDTGGKYRLGFGLVALASAVTADIDLVRYARPTCARLSEQTGETVTLAVPEGDNAVIVHQASSPASVLGADWSGWYLPLHCTPGGKVLLAQLPEARRQAILSQPLQRFTEHTITDPELLQKHLEEFQARGYSYTLDELEVGLSGVGAPVFRSGGAFSAAMSVAGPSFRVTPESIGRLGELTREAADEVSRRLGFY